MKAPRKERIQMFDKFKKRGILKANKEQAKTKNPVYQQERRSETGSGKLVMCSNCNGFFNRKFFSRHLKFCLKETCQATVSVPLHLLSHFEDSNSDGFLHEVLCKLREDEIGLKCREDSVICFIGKRLWTQSKRKADKKNEVRKGVMTSMRRLSALYLLFLKQQEELGVVKQREGNVADMFIRANFTHLEQAVIEYTTKGFGNSTDDLKHGLKTAIYCLIKKACKLIKGMYLIDDEDDKASDVDKFIDVFELSHDYLFGDATYAMNRNRNEKLRKPEALPLEEDIAKVREYTLFRMQAITKESYVIFDTHNFVELRDLLVSRLTLFNARRGGEPCRLRLVEWEDAAKNAWISQQEVQKLDELDRALLKDLKVAYQTGKGNKHLVPILLPPDTMDAMEMIVREENRALAGVNKTNTYVFPSTQDSLSHVSGWHAVNSVIRKLNLQKPDLLTATKNRHRISTMYASMEVPESERRFFYEHMGHSKETNKDIYQAPLALMEVIKVGKSLNQIDCAAKTLHHGQTQHGTTLPVSGVTDLPCTSEMDNEDVTMVSPSVSSSSSASDGEIPLPQQRTIRGVSGKNSKVDNAGTPVTSSPKKKSRQELDEFLSHSQIIDFDWKTVKTKVMNEAAKAANIARKREREMGISEV